MKGKTFKSGKMTDTNRLKEAINDSAVKRIRPKIMTVMITFLGLLPIMIGLGTGSDIMKRIAAPMAGGIFTSMTMELTVYPAIFYIWKKRQFNSVNIDKNQ